MIKRMDIKKIQSVGIALMLVAIVLAILALTKSTFSDRIVFGNPRGTILYSNKWDLYTEDRQKIDTINLPSSIKGKGSRLYIGHTVDNALAYYEGISFLSRDQIVRVYINDRLIYSLDRDRGGSRMAAGGAVWNFIHLRGKVKQGDRMMIEFSNLDHIVFEEDELIKDVSEIEKNIARILYRQKNLINEYDSIKINDIYLGSRHDMFEHIFVRESFTLVLGAVMGTMGMVVTVFGFLPYRNEQRQGHLKYLGMSILFMGIATITNNGVLHFIFFDVARLEHLYGLSKLLAGLCFGIYLLQGNLIRHHLIIRVQIWFICLLLVIEVMGFLFYFGLLIDGLISERSTLIMTCIITLFVLMYEYKPKQKGSSGHLLVALLLLLFFLALSALEENTTTIQASYFEAIGAMVFFFILVLKELRYYSELYERGKSVEYYRELAGRDALTYIKNRTSFMEDLSQYQLQYDMLSVVAFDVDNLKFVNDNLGHAKGDELLQIIASIIQRSFQDLGECYRMSGDEFICVLRNVSVPVVKERLGDAKREMEIETQKRKFTISASFGVAHFEPQFDNKFEQIMRRADENLYVNKKNKPNDRHQKVEMVEVS